MGCIVAKLECCVVAKCCHCIHLRLGCFLVAAITIVFWIGITLFFLLDEGVGFFNADNETWVSRGYKVAILSEAAVRVIISIILVVGAAKKHEKLLTIFLVAWIILIVLVLGGLIFSIAISKLDGATIVFSLAYTAGRFSFGVLALVIVNSYRIQLMDENDQREREMGSSSVRKASPELVL